MVDCADCAGTGTTVIAVIALILVIIIFILLLIFYFFPSNQVFLDIRGVNFNVVTGTKNGTTGNTSDNLDTGTNNLYLSLPLSGNLTLNINSSSRNFVGLVIAVKNTTVPPNPIPKPPINTITLANTSNLTIETAGLSNIVQPGQTAYLVCTTAGVNQVFTVLTI